MKRIAVVLSAVVALSGCKLTLDPDPEKSDASTPTGVDATTPDAGPPPGTITVRGRVCTTKSIDQVKIQFLLDASGSMCVTDGPGAQGTGGFCEVVADYLRGQGVTVPGRVRALKTLMQHLAQQDGISVAIVPFDVAVVGAYPAEGFVPATDPSLTTRIEALQNALGKGTDYQGALADARRRIEADVAKTVAAGKQADLAHTRYLTVLVSDGFPYPRCSSIDDGPTWATAADPSGRWQDNPASFCNTPPVGTDAGNPECLGTDCPGDAGVVYSDVIPDFAIGGDRNQNWDLFAEVDAMAKLQAEEGVGDIRLDTVQLYNKAALTVCGSICYQDLYAIPGGTAEDGRKVARWTLEQLAIRGHGSFHEYSDLNLLSFGWIDTTGVGKPFVAKEPTPFVHHIGANPSHLKEDPIRPDTDGDGFPDDFEAVHASAGFDPNVADARGCKSVGGVAATFLCIDADGDGLSEPMEAYLGTNPYSPDTDGDGLPDGFEVDVDLDPMVSDVGRDRNGNTVSDILEVIVGFDLHSPGNAELVREALPQVTAAPQADGTTCYDFVIKDLNLVDGRNWFTLPFAQVPQGATSLSGVWRQACLLVIPANEVGYDATLSDSDFVPMTRFGADLGQVLPADTSMCKSLGP